ncbi:MAG: CvpA family protein [Kiritimatiellae bacterium]|nr:CvpA family protein [Kiritimatiellia bacterium]
MNFNWVDYAFFASLAAGAAVGFFRGLSRVLGNLLAVLFAACTARAFYESLSVRLSSLLSSLSFARAAASGDGVRLFAMLLLLAGAFFLFRFFLFGLGVLINFNFVPWVERLGGFLAGALWYGATCLVLMWAVSFLDISSLQRAVLFDSQVGQTVMPSLQNAYNRLADAAGILRADRPVGVEAEPGAVMPPGAEIPSPAQGR